MSKNLRMTEKCKYGKVIGYDLSKDGKAISITKKDAKFFFKFAISEML